MTDTAIPVIDRSVLRLGSGAIDLRRHGVTLAMISYMIAKPDNVATTRELAIEQHGADVVSSWDAETLEKTQQAIRTRMHKAARLLSAALGGEWFQIVDRSEKPPRWKLYAATRSVGALPGRVTGVAKMIHAAP